MTAQSGVYVSHLSSELRLVGISHNIRIHGIKYICLKFGWFVTRNVGWSYGKITDPLCETKKCMLGISKVSTESNKMGTINVLTWISSWSNLWLFLYHLTFSGWWLNQPLWKISLRGEHKKSLSCHHLVVVVLIPVDLMLCRICRIFHLQKDMKRPKAWPKRRVCDHHHPLKEMLQLVQQKWFQGPKKKRPERVAKKTQKSDKKSPV